MPEHSFKDVIPLNQPMSAEAAIELLANFHNASQESAIRTFLNLKRDFEGTVNFKESVNGGLPCIVMEGLGTDGKWSWNHLIDPYTGQPQTRTS